MTPSHPSRPTALGKLSPPRLGRVIRRKRLFADIDQFASAPGLWIAGPPGIGKTTLVATYLDARALPCLWLQLDVGDADPATFVHFLRAAAKRMATHRQLRLPLPNADDLRDVPGFIRRCFRHLSLSLDLPWVLVLDNLRELGLASPLHAGICAALAELPEQARLIVISRDPPGPAYARALAGQQLVLIEAPSLRFNDDETAQLVLLHDRNWVPADLRVATDGWAAAMILLLAARSDLDTAAPMQEGAARDRLFVFFAGEVMEKMVPSDVTSLLRIAFLPSATAAMAVALTGDSHAAELMADLAHRSLFTDRRAGSPPAYTFHALFGEFLRARDASTLNAESLAAEMTLGLAIGPLVPDHVTNVSDLVDWMRRNPRLANAGSPGTGTLPHLLEVMLFQQAGVAWQHVVYAGGPPAMVDLLGGQIAALVLPEGLLRQHRTTGRLRVLATSAAHRSAYLPDVATLTEQGYRDLVVREWFAFFMAARVTGGAIDTLSKALRQAIARPELSAAFAESGMAAASSTPAALASRIAAEQRYWEPVLRAGGIRSDS